MSNNFMLSAIRKSRANMLSLTKNCSMAQLNEIPEGFSNNIAWNFAHTVVTMQLLTYGLSDMETHLTPAEIGMFKKGSKPEEEMTEEEWAYWKQKSEETVNQLEADLASDAFKEFKKYPTSFGVELNSVQDALDFNLIHEGIHFGYILALRRTLGLAV